MPASLTPAAHGTLQHQMTVPRGSTAHRTFKIFEAHTHISITVEDEASGECIVQLESTGPEMHCTMEIFVGKSAKASILCINRAHTECSVRITQQGEVQEQGELHWQNITLGGKETSHTLTSRTSGEGAKSTVDWISYARGKEKQHLSATNVFDAPKGRGEITMRSVAEEKANITTRGMIEITERGKGTHTFLRETTLMLDPTAKVDAIPGLEIRTNDVQASHAATVTRVHPEDLFYFASRGIEVVEARKMYIKGFLGDLMQHLPQNSVHFLQEVITQKYNAHTPV